ncbi:hypothetical protein GN244_ATG14507 [Phytophthora infestans]|uniref:Uncharacterized protein n=1 Tax=Phytophthora infestans TaxID=4787 RepID=A0A833RUE5_PHYIN|nr:hypothetical protein GN244_ATG14507 [Phytophthora infestans]KAF4138783.1 hypothetical protein GN958_ATG11992 [Phytophthora infestans]
MTRRAFLDATNKAHERISDKAIITAFEKATEGEESNINYHSRYQELCIPTEMICKAFVIAASNGNLEVEEHLYDYHRISAEAMGESFAGAACSNHVDMMTSLYDGQHISPMAVFQAFKKALVVENPSAL